jgi:hypothetical protein
VLAISGRLSNAVRLTLLVCTLAPLSPVSHAESARAAGTDAAALPDNEKSRATVIGAARRPEPTYSVQVGLDGEIFPVFANFASLQKPQERNWGTVVVRISNPTDAPLRSRVSVKVRGWSDEEIQIAEMGAGEVRTYLFAPTFLPRLYSNREIMAATVAVTATDFGGRLTFATTMPARIRSVDDMYWGSGFKYARFIASWVTPHDTGVEQMLSRAKEFMPGRRLPGYEAWKTPDQQRESTYVQARAIYRAVQNKGVSYVKSSITFGGHNSVSERVRMPYESLRHVSANCIDGVVMFASLFENLGMDPIVVLVPGHAYVGVRTAQTGDRYLYLDTALTGRATFEAALQSAETGMARTNPRDITRIPLNEARTAGIYPMPGPDGEIAPKGLAATTRLR